MNAERTMAQPAINWCFPTRVYKHGCTHIRNAKISLGKHCLRYWENFSSLRGTYIFRKSWAPMSEGQALLMRYSSKGWVSKNIHCWKAWSSHTYSLQKKRLLEEHPMIIKAVANEVLSNIYKQMFLKLNCLFSGKSHYFLISSCSFLSLLRYCFPVYY